MKNAPRISIIATNEKFYLIEGIISELHIESGTKNLLEKIDLHYREPAFLTGLASIAADLYSQASNSAMIAMYDGEETQNFIFLLNDQVVCGQFSGADLILKKSFLKIVTSKKNGVLYAHAILDENRGLIWIDHPYGKRAEEKANFKIAAYSYIFILTFFISINFIFFDRENDEIEKLLIGALSSFFLFFGAALWANNDMKNLSTDSTKIFSLLNFPDSDNVNLNGYRYTIPQQAEPLSMYQLMQKYNDVYHCKHLIKND